MDNTAAIAVEGDSQELSLFHTRPKSNEGILHPLNYPDGSPSPHWLRVRGVDSDAFRIANTKANRQALQIAQEPDDSKRDEMMNDVRLDVITSLVCGWSFAKECTPENVKVWLRDAPQIAEGVDKLAFKRTLFFAKSSTASSLTQEQPSS